MRKKLWIFVLSLGISVIVCMNPMITKAHMKSDTIEKVQNKQKKVLEKWSRKIGKR
ncbi:MAG: hypothetical protein K2M46_08425 [Lachnospiraceae bacterium]|nr:hypothetical protein [Lachnospiraceae bacterium]